MASLIGKADPTLVTAAARAGLSNVPGDYSKQFGIMADANKTLLEGVEAAWKTYETDKKASKKELEDAMKDLRTYGVGIENNADYNMFSDEMDAQVAIWKENGGFQNDSKGLREWERQNNKIMGKYKSNQTALIEAMEAFEDSNSWIDGLEPGDNKFLTSLTKYAKNVDDKSGTHNAKANDYMANNTGADTDKTPEQLWKHLGAEEGEMVKYLDPTTNEFTYITSVDGEVISKKSSEISKMIPKKAITTETTIQKRLNDIAKNPTGTYTDNDSLMNQNWLERVIDEAVQKGESLQYLMNQKYGGMEESFADSLRNGTAAISDAIVKSLSDLGYTIEDQDPGEEGHGFLDKNDFMVGTNYDAIVDEILNGEDTYELRRDLFIDKLDNEVFRHEAEQVSKKTDKTDYGMAMPKHLGGRHRSNETVRDQANKLQTYGKGRTIVMEDDNYIVVEPGKTFKGSDDEIYTLQQVWDNNAMPSGLKRSVASSQQGETQEIETENEVVNGVEIKVPKKKEGIVSNKPKPRTPSIDYIASVIEASDLEGITKEKNKAGITIYYNYEGNDIDAAKKALSQAKGTTGIDNAFIKYENNGKQISKRQYEKLKDKSNVTFKVQIGTDPRDPRNIDLKVEGQKPLSESKVPEVNEVVDPSDPSTVVIDDIDNYTGQVTYTWETSGNTYVGEWKDGDYNGQGTLTWPSGDEYVGEFKDGMKHGQGTLTWPSGDEYVGEFKDGMKHGQGTYTWPSGIKYVGEYKDGKIHGQGTYTWPSGSKYVGEYKDGEKSGQGAYTYADGSIYEGEWKDGLSHGQGTLTWPDGDTWTGEWKNDKEHGKGQYTWKDGTPSDPNWYWEGVELDGGEKEFLKKQKAAKKSKTPAFDASKDPLKKEMLKNKKKNASAQKGGEIPDIAEAFPKQPEEKEKGAKPGDLLLKPESSAIKGPISQKAFLKQGGVETKVNEVATKHGFSMENLLNLINKESNFDTTAVNKDSKATGLIQFMPKTAIGLGTTTEKISKMSILEQLDLIDKYFTQNHKKGEHPYITIAYPKAHNMGMDEIIATPSDSIAKQNPPWRNKDGNVTKRSIIAYADKV